MKLNAQLEALNKHQEYMQALYERAARKAREEAEARANPSPYNQFLKKICPPGWDLDAPHIKQICAALDEVKAGKTDRLAIFMPPRHGKTETITVRFPVYWWSENPTDNILVTGYNDKIARRFSRKTRNIAKLHIPLDKTKHGVDEWDNAAGASMLARGVGSPPTGVGFKIILIDDPIRRRKDANSETYRDDLWDWYLEDLYSRLEPGGAIIMVLTRWHHDDLAARAMASEPDKWKVLKLPAIAEQDESFRKEGDALWPARYPIDALERIKRVMKKKEGGRAFESLYQQNPTPREGSIFKVSRINIRATVPARFIKLARGWDLAATEDAGDFSSSIKWGRTKEGEFWILHATNDQLSARDRNLLIKNLSKEDGQKCRVILPQDPGQAGKDQAQYLTRMLAPRPVKTRPVSGSKEVRAGGWADQMEAGNIYMVEAPWNAVLIEQLRNFPSGKHDDLVDAGSDGFNEVALTASNDYYNFS